MLPVSCLVTLLITLAATPLPAAIQEPGQIREVSLDRAIQEALDNNHRRPVSRFAVAMAEARHRQALAAYWPQLATHVTQLHMNASPNFIVPEADYTIPAQLIPLTPGMSITLNTPTGPQSVTEVSIPEKHVTTPPQEIILKDKDETVAALQTQWLLYDGGMRKGYNEQTRAALDMMQQAARRTDLEIIDSVKRYYYGAVLARQLHQIGMDTLARMEITLSLTETLYKEGSGQVKKTDWLTTTVMVESLRALVALLEKNKVMAQAALANGMGLPWDTSVRPLEQTIPFTPVDVPLEELVSTTYRFNPDWAGIKAEIQAAQGAVRAARSGYFPKIALTGELYKWWNDQDTGSATKTNKEGWSVAMGIECTLFDGFLTRARVAETRAREAEIKEQKILLKEGLGLKVRDIFLSLAATVKAQQATRAAMDASIDNRDLNIRAYQHGLVTTEDVIKAQLVEAFMSAQHYKTRFDHIALQSQLDLTVGTTVLDVLGGN
ncbi:MAG: transporter [Deltaproteobacteria bacterium]|nr:MAG: transporter [Deltaproteobacteria bacterium]